MDETCPLCTGGRGGVGQRCPAPGAVRSHERAQLCRGARTAGVPWGRWQLIACLATYLPACIAPGARVPQCRLQGPARLTVVLDTLNSRNVAFSFFDGAGGRSPSGGGGVPPPYCCPYPCPYCTLTPSLPLQVFGRALRLPAQRHDEYDAEGLSAVRAERPSDPWSHCSAARPGEPPSVSPASKGLRV